MKTRLLATKFHIPTWRATGVPRPRLVELLTAGLRENRKLTLVCAPAGYGKTTLVTGWIDSLSGANHRAAWLALDEADNDPARFFSYWLAAFQQLDESISAKIQPLFSLPQLPPIGMVLDELLNELAALEDPILLTLDDYHLISSSQIHEALEYFLDHQPAQCHLVILTRQDPPLPLARLRARGQMTEVRASDLRFTPEEARQFFINSMKLNLTDEAADVLEARTEGWAVGLQLAGLALQHMTDPQRFIETFRGSHRYVLDYLAEEVIHQLGEEIRSFLTRTSVLDRFNADVCFALTGRSDSQAVIAYLEQANLFVVALDNERIWYRYHHLFSDYLRTLLDRPEQTALYKKASAWHETHDLMVEAVRYALASGDPDFCADVIERAVEKDSTWSGGNIALLSGWLEALPPQVFLSRPQLALNSSRILYLTGRFELAEKRIDQAEQTLKSLPVTPETEQMLALSALYRGSIASVRGDVEQAIEQTLFARARLPRENHLAHARAFFSLGLAYEISDQTAQAVENYLQSSDEARSAGVLFLAVHGLCAAAQVQISQGRLYQAEQTCRQAIQLTEGLSMAPLGLAWSILGGIAVERNDLKSAEQALLDGISLSRQGGLMDDVVAGLAHLSRLRVVQGDTASALAAIQEVKSIMQDFGVERMEAIASAYLARVQLYMGQKQMAAQWAAQVQAMRVTVNHELVDMTLVRVMLATGELDTIPSILHSILEKATAAGRMQTCIESMLLLALFHQAKQDVHAALDWLGKSLRLAAPEGYARIFLDEGKMLLDLLPKARHLSPELVDTLLGQSGQPEGPSRPAPHEQLPDPLSEQELRVLHLIVEGKSNQQIAAELFISVGTAKWHVHNVLQKLGVGNRSQAIARARELNI